MKVYGKIGKIVKKLIKLGARTPISTQMPRVASEQSNNCIRLCYYTYKTDLPVSVRVIHKVKTTKVNIFVEVKKKLTEWLFVFVYWYIVWKGLFIIYLGFQTAILGCGNHFLSRSGEYHANLFSFIYCQLSCVGSNK